MSRRSLLPGFSYTAMCSVFYACLDAFGVFSNDIPADNNDNDNNDTHSQVYGRLYDTDTSYFPRKITEYTILERPSIAKPDFGEHCVVYFGVDTGSHQSSHMGFSAVAYTTTGTCVVLGMAELSLQRCEIAQVEMCIGKFVSRVLRHHSIRQRSTASIRVVPIVECNATDVTASSVVTAIIGTARGCGCDYIMPFKKQYFPSAITENIGIWATEDNKLEAIHDLYTMMVKHQLVFVSRMVTMGPIHLADAVDPTEKATKELLRDELVQIKDDIKGKVSGKTSDTNDDLALSLFWAVKFSGDIQKIAARENMLHVPIPSRGGAGISMLESTPEEDEGVAGAAITTTATQPTRQPLHLNIPRRPELFHPRPQW